MLSSILLAATSVGLFIYSMVLFQEKGPIPTTSYMLAKPDERTKMKTKAEYRFTGRVMLIISGNFFLMAIMIGFNIVWLSNVIMITWVALAIYVLVYAIREMIRL